MQQKLRFNPLLIGEAAPPDHLRLLRGPEQFVSIPFSSGRRRRLILRPVIDLRIAGSSFQSPSHRGGGAAPPKLARLVATPRHRFNPLLIGEAAPPLVRFQDSQCRACHSFNPLLIGEAAPPRQYGLSLFGGRR